MSITEIVLLALSLAVDCFTVCVASGVIIKRLEWRTFLFMSLMFGLFQGAMPLLGWAVANRFSHAIEAYDHWIAFGLLLFLGIRMIVSSFSKDEQKQIDPRSMAVVLTLAVATSIDALAVGVTFAFAGMGTLAAVTVPVAVIGAVSFAVSMAGCIAGALFGRMTNLHMEFFGGLVLISIGVKILWEHLFMLGC